MDSPVKWVTDSSDMDTEERWTPSLCDWELRAVWGLTVTVSNPSSISGLFLTLADVAQSHGVHQHPPPHPRGCQAGDFCCGDRAGEEGSGRREDGLCAWSLISRGRRGQGSGERSKQPVCDLDVQPQGEKQKRRCANIHLLFRIF